MFISLNSLCTLNQRGLVFIGQAYPWDTSIDFVLFLLDFSSGFKTWCILKRTCAFQKCQMFVGLSVTSNFVLLNFIEKTFLAQYL